MRGRRTYAYYFRTILDIFQFQFSLGFAAPTTFILEKNYVNELTKSSIILFLKSMSKISTCLVV